MTLYYEDKSLLLAPVPCMAGDYSPEYLPYPATCLSYLYTHDSLLLASMQWAAQTGQQLPVINLHKLIIGTGQARLILPGHSLSIETISKTSYLFLCAILVVSLCRKMIKIALLCRHAVYNDEWKIRVARPFNFKGARSFSRFYFLAAMPLKKLNP